MFGCENVSEMDLAAKLRLQTISPGFVRPDYEQYCFSNVPGTAAEILDCGGWKTLPNCVLDDVSTDVDNVVVLLIDGLGWEQYTEVGSEHRFFEKIDRNGQIIPLTSIFPSETPSCIPTIHTGLQTCEHGQLGWFVYLPEEDLVVEPLEVQSGKSDTLNSNGAELFSGTPMYETLGEAGVESHVVEPFDSSEDPKTNGATSHPYDSVGEFGLEIRRVLEDATDLTYCYAYTPLVDSAGHQEGSSSELVRSELRTISAALDYQLTEELSENVARNTLLLFVADHGQVDCPPNRTVDLLAYPEISDHILRDRNGTLAVSGCPRDLHLFLKPGTKERVRSVLQKVTDAMVLDREEALEKNLWGNREPSTMFRERVGDLVVVPDGDAIWHSEHPAELELVGYHGGLHEREQLVPFGAVRLDAIR